MTCFSLLPFFEAGDVVDWGDEYSNLPECLREEHHEGRHLVQLPNKEFILWRFDDNCGCWEEYCECYNRWEISPAEAEEFIKNKSRH